MQVETKPLSTPVKVSVVVDAADVKTRKEEIYASIKSSLPVIDGFRKGTIPRDIAESKFGVEKLYKQLMDDVYREVANKENFVSAKDFEIFGDLKDDHPFKMEFVAEVQPQVELADFETLGVSFVKDTSVTDEEVSDSFEKTRKQRRKLVDLERDTLENLDIAIIDFEGVILGEKKPFAGGTAKDYQLIVNLENRSFVDNFEEQLIGMKVGAQKTVSVKFPANYRDTTKAGKHAEFKVVLRALKREVLPELNDAFAEEMGHTSLAEFREKVRQNLSNNKKHQNLDNLKKTIFKTLLDKSTFTPVPLDMVSQEVTREWRSMLRRIDKTEELYLKENPSGREQFIAGHKDAAEDFIKTTLILKAVAKKFEITASKDEVVTYCTNLSTAMGHDEKAKAKLLDDLNDTEVFSMQQQAAINEKVVDFLSNYWVTKSN